MANGKDPSDFINRLAETYRQVRFSHGVVGKTSHAIVALFALWGIVLWRLSENLWFDVALLVAGGVVTGIYCWWVGSTQKFAKENPELALLEGAELIEYRKWEAGIKGQPNPKLPLVPNPHGEPRTLRDLGHREE